MASYIPESVKKKATEYNDAYNPLAEAKQPSEAHGKYTYLKGMASQNYGEATSSSSWVRTGTELKAAGAAEIQAAKAGKSYDEFRAMVADSGVPGSEAAGQGIKAGGEVAGGAGKGAGEIVHGGKKLSEGVGEGVMGAGGGIGKGVVGAGEGVMKGVEKTGEGAQKGVGTLGSGLTQRVGGWGAGRNGEN